MCLYTKTNLYVAEGDDEERNDELRECHDGAVDLKTNEDINKNIRNA
jgi:hypothetical protein